MDLNRLTRKAKDLVDKRGGTESLKQDAEELKNIARGQGSMGDKAKEAFEAVKKPGGPRRAEADADAPQRPGGSGAGPAAGEPAPPRPPDA